jgi:hypothetical protein
LLSLALCAVVALAGTSALAVEVRIPTNIEAATASCVVVPVIVEPSSGVLSMDLSFAYDGSLLVPTGVYPTAATGGFVLSFDQSTPGVVGLTLSSAIPLSSPEAEEVAWVTFDVVGAGGASSDLEWVAAVLNGGALPSTTGNGRVTIRSAGSVVEMPDDLDHLPGTTFDVPVLTNDATGAESFDIIVRFNPDVIDALDVSKTPLTQSMILTTFLGNPGEVRISLFTVSAIAGGGPIVRITFEAVGNLGDRTPLDLTKGVMNEGVIPTALDDGLLILCSPADLDTDGFSSCDGDCNEADPAINPGAVEICDGIDNDCDGVLDTDAPVPGSTPVLLLDREAGDDRLDWSKVPGATGYDLIRGDLSALIADGDYTPAVDVCLLDDTQATSTTDGTLPEIGEGIWYLLRSVNCGGSASYDSNAATQDESRDAEVIASPLSCL